MPSHDLLVKKLAICSAVPKPLSPGSSSVPLPRYYVGVLGCFENLTLTPSHHIHKYTCMHFAYNSGSSRSRHKVKNPCVLCCLTGSMNESSLEHWASQEAEQVHRRNEARALNTPLPWGSGLVILWEKYKNKNSCLLSTYCMPGPVLCPFHILFYMTLSTWSKGRCHYNYVSVRGSRLREINNLLLFLWGQFPGKESIISLLYLKYFNGFPAHSWQQLKFLQWFSKA